MQDGPGRKEMERQFGCWELPLRSWSCSGNSGSLRRLSTWDMVCLFSSSLKSNHWRLSGLGRLHSCDISDQPTEVYWGVWVWRHLHRCSAHIPHGCIDFGIVLPHVLGRRSFAGFFAQRRQSTHLAFGWGPMFLTSTWGLRGHCPVQQQFIIYF